MTQNNLLIYNASAGSGKTFKLVTQYISILLSEKVPRKKFRSIAAMTFTNKAALEMKDRIIQYLYALKTNDSNAHYVFKEIEENTQLNQEEISLRAKVAFREILHSYEDFQVSTIDKFNLKLIRSFNKDLDISGDFEVILDEKEIHESVVDLLLNKFGQAQENDLSELITRYAKSNIEVGEQWNFRNKLIDFCGILSREKNRIILSQLKSFDFSKKNYQELMNQIMRLEKNFISNAQEIHNKYVSLNLDIKIIPGKSDTHRALVSLNNLEQIPPPKTSGSLFNKKLIEICFDDKKSKELSIELSTKIVELHALHLNIYSEYLLLKKFRSNYFNLALLKLINESIEEYKKTKRIIRISDFNQLIGNLVQQEEAPYIYEKIGNRLEHFLLDEFQDTSRLQWLNLVPLIHESISKDRKNIIVGDPKQSIYRFNNGMAEQFVALPKIYNPERDPFIDFKSAYFESMGKKIELSENYRSAANIVLFNNHVFGFIFSKISQKAQNFYTGSNQAVISKLSGYVSVETFGHNLSDDEINRNMLSIITSCQNQGHLLGEIAILTEKNVDGNRIANFLNTENIPVVSSDSILLKNNSLIKLTIYYLYIRLSPSNKTFEKRFAEMYLKTFEEDYLKLYSNFLKVDKTKAYVKNIFHFDSFINFYFGSHDAFYCTYTSLYDLVSQFISLIKVKELDNTYIHHLMDFIFDYQNTKDSDLKQFLAHFELKKKKLALQLPDSDSAVKIMTIHKSKGLEFPIVIIPNLNFGVAINSQHKQLMSIDEKVIYTRLKKESEIAEIADETEEELESVFIDKLNLAYVALTRPKSKIFVSISSQNKGLGHLFTQAIQSFPETSKTQNGFLLVLGENSKAKQFIRKERVKMYSPKSSHDIGYQPTLVKPKMGNEIKNSELIYGTLFHECISKCDFKKDLEENLNIIFNNMSIDFEQELRLKRDISNFYEQLIQKNFIAHAEKILAESSILTFDSITQRPDLIIIQPDKVLVIELKTVKLIEKHKVQLREYLKTLSLLDTENRAICGFLYSTVCQKLIPLNI